MSTKIKKKAEAVKAVKAVAKKTVKVAAPKAVKAVAPVVATATTAYEIESDAFFPPSKRASRGSAAYPFAALTIGQSFSRPLRLSIRSCSPMRAKQRKNSVASSSVSAIVSLRPSGALLSSTPKRVISSPCVH